MSEAHESVDGDARPLDRDWESEARAMGWHPQTEFNGDPADFVDAKAFVLRGEERLPILQKDNKVLKGKLRDSERDTAALRQQMGEMTESLKTMRDMMVRGQEVGYQRAKAEFEQQMEQAVANGDTAGFKKIQGEMVALDKQHETLTAQPKPRPAVPKGPKGSPEFQAWQADNDEWLKADPVLVKGAIDAELALRNGDEVLTEAQVWERVTEMVQTKYPRRFAAATGITPEPSPSGSAPRRSATVLAPSGGAPASSLKKGGIASIQDPEERKVAQAAFNSIKRGMPDFTEVEYMQGYTNPNYDPIPAAMKRRANGSARTNCTAARGQNRPVRKSD